MSSELLAARWYVLHVKSRSEWVVSAGLRGMGYEEFVPCYRARRQWTDRVKEVELPLFAGYVFCRLDASRRLPVLTIPGVTGIVGTRQGPLAVDGGEIAALRLIAGSGAAAAPWPYLEAGQQVRIDRGPLRHLEGLLVEVKNRYRVVVSVAILQRSVAAEVDRDSITPIYSGRARAEGLCHSRV